MWIKIFCLALNLAVFTLGFLGGGALLGFAYSLSGPENTTALIFMASLPIFVGPVIGFYWQNLHRNAVICATGFVAASGVVLDNTATLIWILVPFMLILGAVSALLGFCLSTLWDMASGSAPEPRT